MPAVARVLIRILPLVSAALAYLATQLPWLTVHFAQDSTIPLGIQDPGLIDSPVSGDNGVFAFVQLLPLPALSRRMLESAGWVLTALPLFGMLFGLFLLWRASARIFRIAYTLWLVLTTLLTVFAIIGLNHYSVLFCGDRCVEISASVSHLELGLWVAVASLVIGWSALAGMLWLRRKTTDTEAPSGVARGGLSAAIFSAGAALWAVGLLALPWATAGCSGLQFSFNHFVRGTCSGLDGADVMTIATNGDYRPSWIAIELLSVVGVYLLVTVWLSRLPRITWLVTLSWTVLLVPLFALGVRGVQVSLSRPVLLGYASVNPATFGSGVVVCLLGIALSGIGGVLLLRAARQTT